MDDLADVPQRPPVPICHVPNGQRLIELMGSTDDNANAFVQWAEELLGEKETADALAAERGTTVAELDAARHTFQERYSGLPADDDWYKSTARGHTYDWRPLLQPFVDARFTCVAMSLYLDVPLTLIVQAIYNGGPLVTKKLAAVVAVESALVNGALETRSLRSLSREFGVSTGLVQSMCTRFGINAGDAARARVA